MAPQRGPLLLLALSLGLAGAQKTLDDVPVQPGFNAHEVEGRWLTVQLAASHAHLVSPDDPLRLGLHSIWTRGEDVEFVLFWTGEGVCKGVNITVHPTGLQGQFQGSLEGGTSVHVCFVSTDYSSLILYVRLEDAGEVTSLWALLARRTRGDPTWLRKFLEYAARFHLQKAPVFNLDDRYDQILPQNCSCEDKTTPPPKATPPRTATPLQKATPLQGIIHHAQPSA